MNLFDIENMQLELSKLEDLTKKEGFWQNVELSTKTVKNMNEAEEMMQDKELKELAEEEYYSSKEKITSYS